MSSDLQNPQATVTGIAASWIVPTVAPTAVDRFSSAWIGIGGQFDQTLIQCGTEADYFGGQAVYSAWYELLPRTSITIQSITVLPGDQMFASIQLSNAQINQWIINVTDVSSRQSFQSTFTYLSSQLSAEWIVERPNVNRVLSPLANFGSEVFTNCTTIIGSVTGGISSFPANQVVMYSSTSPLSPQVQMTDVSALNAAGDAFTVNYLASG